MQKQLFQEWGRGAKNSGVGDSCMIYLVYCKSIWKCHKVPPPSTTIKGQKKSVANDTKCVLYKHSKILCI
jgi:hypothetical protein